MESYILIISIIASLLIGLKLRSSCCGKECSLSIEKQQDNDDMLQSIRITKRSKVRKPTLKIPDTSLSKTSDMDSSREGEL